MNINIKTDRMPYPVKFHKDEIKHFTFLVTGGGGFVGSNISEYLLEHNAGKVKVLDNFSTGFRENIIPFLADSRFELIEGDITDIQVCKDACKDVHFVIHQAALGSVPRSIENPIATNLNNVNGFLNMLVAARDAGVKRFVYASSSSVFGDSPILPKKEENTGNLLSPYAVSKSVNELYASVFHSVYGMETIGLRYFNIFGARQNPAGAYAAVIPLFFENILNNVSPQIDGDGEQTRDFTYVENAVQANIKAVFCSNAKALGEVFNIAVGESTSINELFEIIKELAVSQVKPVYRNARSGDIRQSLADISKATKIIGYEPRVKIAEGLKLSLEWYKTNLFNS